MFDYAGRQGDPRQLDAADRLDEMDVMLRQAGLVPPPRYGISHNCVCGTALRVSVREVLQDSEAGREHLRLLGGLVGQQVPVTLSAEDFPGENQAIESWQRFCEVVQGTLDDQNLPGHYLGLCLHSHQMPLEAYCLIADAVIGRGPRFVFLDSLQMSAHSNPAVDVRAKANWSFLWRQSGSERPVMPVYGGIVRSACPLLADEVAVTVLPGGGLNAPARSAWLPITLPMTMFANAAGQIRWRSLVAAIGIAVSIAERMHDCVCWPDPLQVDDAHDNRRLGIVVTELGDLIARRGDDPTSLSGLRWLVDVITRLRAELQARSRQIATRQGPVPVLQEANLVRQWRAGPQRESWRRHWDEAVRQSALRHRNLLVISPYAVIPSRPHSAPGYSDLLPVIGLADAWTFAAPPDFSGWDACRYRHFHRRARATIQGSHTASFVAAGV